LASYWYSKIVFHDNILVAFKGAQILEHKSRPLHTVTPNL